MSHSTRVFITGTGAVCSAGHTVDLIWDAIVNRRSAIADITQWDASDWPVRKAGEVTQVNKRTLVPDRKLHKSIGRTDLFGLYAADSAVSQSGVVEHRTTLEEKKAARFSDRTGVFSGSGGGTYQCNYDYLPLLSESGEDMRKFGTELTATVNPMWLLRNLPNNVLCHVGIRHGFKGTNGCVANQCLGGVQAIAESAAALRIGEADRMVAVGHDTAVEPETILRYNQVGLLSEDDVLRPFDEDRTGTVLGEGAAGLVLETAGSATARNAAVLGEFLGSGCCSEAQGVLHVRPDGDGVSRAIELALKDARVSPEEVGMIVAHGNGTPSSDASESLAINHVFGGNAPPVTAFKWAFGHLIAASGSLDCVLALAALQAKIAPGIGTLKTLDPAMTGLPVSAENQSPRSDIALIICRGFGGTNMAMLLRAPI